MVGLLVKGVCDREKGVVRASEGCVRPAFSEAGPGTERETPDDVLHGDRGGKTKIMDNTFTENDTGIIFTREAQAQVQKNDLIDDGIGIYIDNSQPNLGKGMSGKNRIVSTLYSVYNKSSFDIKAEGNYWGTMDPDSIAAKIYDFYDDPNLGIVDFEPYWDGIEAFAGGPQSKGKSPLLFSIKPVRSPSVGGVRIDYFLTLPARIEISFFDPVGRRVFYLNRREDSGLHQVERTLPAGVYFIRININNQELGRKVVVILPRCTGRERF